MRVRDTRCLIKENPEKFYLWYEKKKMLIKSVVLNLL